MQNDEHGVASLLLGENIPCSISSINTGKCVCDHTSYFPNIHPKYQNTNTCYCPQPYKINFDITKPRTYQNNGVCDRYDVCNAPWVSK